MATADIHVARHSSVQACVFAARTFQDDKWFVVTGFHP
jgi:hypothetical protein